MPQCEAPEVVLKAQDLRDGVCPRLRHSLSLCGTCRTARRGKRNELCRPRPAAASCQGSAPGTLPLAGRSRNAVVALVLEETRCRDGVHSRLSSDPISLCHNGQAVIATVSSDSMVRCTGHMPT